MTWDDDVAPSVEIDDAECTRQTERAILVRIDGKEHWIPQSVVNDDSEVYAAGHSGKLVIAGWFARKHGLGD